MSLKKTNPNTILRVKLLRLCLESGISLNTIMELTEGFDGMTDQQKEERAGWLIKVLTGSKNETEILSKIQEYKGEV